MEDFINTSFNDILDTLEALPPEGDQSAAGIDVFNPLFNPFEYATSGFGLDSRFTRDFRGPLSPQATYFVNTLSIKLNRPVTTKDVARELELMRRDLKDKNFVVLGANLAKILSAAIQEQNSTLQDFEFGKITRGDLAYLFGFPRIVGSPRKYFGKYRKGQGE